MARKLSKSDKAHFQHQIRKVKKGFPLRYPVKVLCVPQSRVAFHWGKGAVAGTKYRNRVFEIYISNCLNYDERVEALSHEYSHALDASENGVAVLEGDPHNESRWGPCYARVHNFMTTEEHDG